MPLVDSTIRAPGARSPRALARSTMCRAGRSFIPPGLNPSSFAQKPCPAGANGSAIRITGVLPTKAPGRSEDAVGSPNCRYGNVGWSSGTGGCWAGTVVTWGLMSGYSFRRAKQDVAGVRRRRPATAEVRCGAS